MAIFPVENDFELICWDFVYNPSTHGVFYVNNTLFCDDKDDAKNKTIFPQK